MGKSSSTIVKAVLFDLDGVLVDACDWHYEALNCALQEIAGFIINREEHLTRFDGLPTKVKMRMLQDEKHITAQQAEMVWPLKQKYTEEIITQKAHYDKRKIYMLRQLQKHNIEIACITNSIRRTARLMLFCTGQLSYIDYLYSNEDVSKPKPYPEGYWSAMIKFGVLPHEALIVEDLERGVKAAKATGAHIWQVKNATRVTWENLSAVLENCKCVS